MLWHFINPSEICILNIIVVQRNERSESTEQHQKNSQGSNAKKSSDFLITFFWLLCCLLRVMRIMFSVRTGVRQFYIILKWESPFKAPLLPLTASAARLFRRTTCLIFIITAMKIARSQHIWHLFFFFLHVSHLFPSLRGSMLLLLFFFFIRVKQWCRIAWQRTDVSRSCKNT